ncbi:fluoride efflux transporter CrcB [Methanopyrus sp.]
MALGGALGSVARYLISGAVPGTMGVPWGTVAVNGLGSFLLGFVMWSVSLGLRLSPEVRALLTVGFCGGLTTFSTFAYELVELEAVSPSLAALYLLTNLGVGVLGVLGGMALAHLYLAGRG